MVGGRTLEPLLGMVEWRRTKHSYNNSIGGSWLNELDTETHIVLWNQMGTDEG